MSQPSVGGAAERPAEPAFPDARDAAFHLIGELDPEARRILYANLWDLYDGRPPVVGEPREPPEPTEEALENAASILYAKMPMPFDAQESNDHWAECRATVAAIVRALSGGGPPPTSEGT